MIWQRAASLEDRHNPDSVNMGGGWEPVRRGWAGCCGGRGGGSAAMEPV